MSEPSTRSAADGAGESPYRANDAALKDLIPRDWRREKLVAAIAASVLVGASLGYGAPLLRSRMLKATHAAATPYRDGPLVGRRIEPVVLDGPGGPVRIPAPQPLVVNVWLQGCQDCMPAFQAMAQLRASGEANFGVPTVNVAYGEAELEWARRYGVDERLAFDVRGGQIVTPLGISSFTTLVVDRNGYVRLVDRPDRPGFAQRVTGAAHALASEPQSDSPPVAAKGEIHPVSGGNGKCLDITGASPAAGAALIQWPCTGQPNQAFDFQSAGRDDEFTIVAKHSKQCLDVTGASKAPGTGILQWPCAGAPNQTFVATRNDDDSWQLVAKHSGLCIEARSDTADGTQLVQNTCNGASNQHFVRPK